MTGGFRSLEIRGRSFQSGEVWVVQKSLAHPRNAWAFGMAFCFDGVTKKMTWMMWTSVDMAALPGTPF